jgi:hypothetical protein
MAEPPGPGCYPRVNGSMIQSDHYKNKIVSVVGYCNPSSLAANNHGSSGRTIPFTTSDDVMIQLNVEQVEAEMIPQNVSSGSTTNGSVRMEIIGSVESSNQVMVRKKNNNP